MRFFRDLPGVHASISERKDGAFRSFAADTTSREARRERRHYFARLDIPPQRVVAAGLVHGARVRTVVAVPSRRSLRRIRGVDGLLTSETNLYLAITIADCFPVYFYDPKQNNVGIAHAGWRGIVKGVVPAALEAMQRLGSRPSDVVVVLGPGLRKCHFEIREDTLSRFRSWPEFVEKTTRRIVVDLPGIIRAQLGGYGVRDAHIRERHMCTYTAERRCFSHRRVVHRGLPDRHARMIALIGLPNA